MTTTSHPEPLTIHSDWFLRLSLVVGFTNRYRSKDGPYRWIAWKSSTDQATGLIYAVARDITERRQATDQLQLYADIVKHMQVGLHVYHLEAPDDDHTLRMIEANPASAVMTGVPVPDVVGRTLDENVPALRERDVPQLYRRLARGALSGWVPICAALPAVVPFKMVLPTPSGDAESKSVNQWRTTMWDGRHRA